jgi:hypothetical protein
MVIGLRECITIGRGWGWNAVALSLGCALATVFLGGCKDRGPQRVVVSGTITYNGKPVPAGDIRFVPVGASGAPMAGAEIKDGKYRADGHGGVPVATHKIEIEAYRADPTGKTGNTPPPVMARGAPRYQYLPKRYNTDSELKITIEPGSKQLTKDFDLAE